jgi:hypothetical protein
MNGDYDYKSKYFPDMHLMLTEFDHRVMNAIVDIEKRIDALEEREMKYTITLEE